MSITYPLKTFKRELTVIIAVFKARIKIFSRYPGLLIMDIIIPLLFILIPVLLGNAIAGSPQNASQNFSRFAGTTNYIGYLIIGTGVFGLITTAFWNFSMWLRREMVTGTIEVNFMSPAKKLSILAGLGLYVIIRGLLTFFIALFVASFIFQANVFTGDLLVAMIFLILGLFPMFGLSLAVGAIVIKVKQPNALMGLIQWIVAVFMGVIYPITVLPPIIRWIAYLFPPTWQNNGVRAALLNVSWFLGSPLADLGMILLFTITGLIAGLVMYNFSEKTLKKNEGIGTF